MPGIIQWLFTVRYDSNAGADPPFHLWVPWIIFCALGVLLPLYYYLEGRKRFFGSHALNKYLMDRVMYRHLLPVALVGWIVMGGMTADQTLLSWRFWRYLWLLWIAGIVIYWLYYFSFRYAGDLAWYRNKRTMEKYYPQPRSKRKAAKAGAR